MTDNFIDDVRRKVKRGFWGNLVRANTGVSSLNFFVILTTLAGLALLTIVPFAIVWEVLHNNMVASDLSGWAAFIGAVSTLFGAAGISKSWSNWSENKFRGQNSSVPFNGEHEIIDDNDNETLSDDHMSMEE